MPGLSKRRGLYTPFALLDSRTGILPIAGRDQKQGVVSGMLSGTGSSPCEPGTLERGDLPQRALEQTLPAGIMKGMSLLPTMALTPAAGCSEGVGVGGTIQLFLERVEEDCLDLTDDAESDSQLAHGGDNPGKIACAVSPARRSATERSSESTRRFHCSSFSTGL